MAQWQWQPSPGPAQAAAPNRPRCFGAESAFDITCRECRGCEYQSSCRDTIFRARNNQFQAPQAPPQQRAPSYFDPRYNAPSVPQQIAQSYQTQQVAMPVQVPRQQAPIQQWQQPQIPQAYEPPPQFHYGWLNDPLYYTGNASPPPHRPQLAGETFFERVVKNMGLSMLESFFFQGFLAVRQMVLPPGQAPQQPQDGPIDVSPP